MLLIKRPKADPILQGSTGLKLNVHYLISIDLSRETSTDTGIIGVILVDSDTLISALLLNLNANLNRQFNPWRYVHPPVMPLVTEPLQNSRKIR